MNLKNVLFNLCSIEKISGREEKINKFLVSILKNFSNKVQTNVNNSVVAEINKSDVNKMNIVLTAHIDEIGFMVVEITDSGFLKLKNCGGINLNLASYQPVVVYGKQNLLGFTLMSKQKELYVDVGLDKLETKKLVNLGDRVGFKFNKIDFNNGRISTKSLDNCAGVATILLILNILKEVKLHCNLTVVFSSQEETTGTGIITSINMLNKVDIAIYIDVSFAQQTGSENNTLGKLHKGPMIGISPLLDLNLVSKLKKVAQENKIKYQLEIMNGLTSTDVDRSVVLKTGLQAILTSVPLKYMHSPIEIIDLFDIEQTAKLIANFIKSI